MRARARLESDIVIAMKVAQRRGMTEGETLQLIDMTVRRLRSDPSVFDFRPEVARAVA